jgi:D-tagatose-1,6-bisphosphate aldolase subunit GatZ/KbaZ
MLNYKNLPSFCTSNDDVIETIFDFCKIFNLPLLIECTSNQVNQFGGYSGLNTKSFKKNILKISKIKKFKKKKLYIGADHLGPLPWMNLKEDKAMLNAKKLFKDTINCNFDKIHIDTGMMLKSDIILPRKKIIDRCLEIFKLCNKNKIKNIFFVFGTEVPIAGGGKIKQIKPTKLQSIKEEIKYYKMIKKNFSLVIEPGIGFENDFIKKPSFKNFKKKNNFSKRQHISFEAHSTDYQSILSLKKLVKNNFKFLKVGPELTYNYLKAILIMEKLEKKYYKKNYSSIKKILLSEMNKNKPLWNKYYKKNINFLKLNSLLDRARYFWNKNKVVKAKETLIKNINNIDTEVLLKKFEINDKKLLSKYLLKFSNFDIIKFFFLFETLKKYYLACGFKRVYKYYKI